MEERNKNIDDLFREGLDDYRETPPASVWSSLDQRLPVANPSGGAGGAMSAEEPSRRWLWYLLLLALLGTLIYFGARNMLLDRKGNAPINQNISTLKPANTEDSKTAPIANPAPTSSSSASSISDKPIETDKHQTGTSNSNIAEAAAAAGKTLVSETGNRSGRGQKTTAADDNQQKHVSTNRNSASQRLATSNSLRHTARTASKHIAQAGLEQATPVLADDNKTTKQQETGNRATVKRPVTSQEDAVAKETPAAAPSRTTPPVQPAISTGTAAQTAQPTTETGAAAENTAVAQMTQNSKPGKKSHMVVTQEDGGAPKAQPASAASENQAVQEAGDANADLPAIADKAKQEAIKTGMTHNTKQTATRNASGMVGGNTSVTKTRKSTRRPSTLAASPDLSAKSGPATVSPSSLSKSKKAARQKAGNAVAKAEPNATPAGVEAAVSKTAGKAASKTKVADNAVAAEPARPGNSKTKKIAETAAKPIASSRKNGSTNTAGSTVSSAQAKTSMKAAPAVATPRLQPTAANTGKPAPQASEPARATASQPPAATTPAETEEEEGKAAAQGGGESGGGASAPLRNFRKFNFNADAGIRAGYEKGLSGGPSAFVFAPFLQWNLTPKIALVLQPGFRYNQISSATLLAEGPYHKLISQTIDSQFTVTLDSLQQTLIERKYYYTNIYDSIRAGYKLHSKTYWEIDIPLTIQYSISQHLAITGGLSLSFGKVNQVEGSSTEFHNLVRQDTVSYAPTLISNPAPTPPGYLDHFSYNSLSYSSINTADYQSPTANGARFGYIVGLSYWLNDRLAMDVMVRQNISDMKFIPNASERKMYSQPYFRFTLGYKMFKSR